MFRGVLDKRAARGEDEDAPKKAAPTPGVCFFIHAFLFSGAGSPVPRPRPAEREAGVVRLRFPIRSGGRGPGTEAGVYTGFQSRYGGGTSLRHSSCPLRF